MKTPAFWSSPASAPAQLLRPAGALYGAIAARLMARPGARADAPVVTIGNFVVGGAGKTPVAIAVARALIARGETPAFVSRGYGGSVSTPVRVSDQDSAVVGDEPLLLARLAPTFVGVDRVAATALAVATVAPSVVILDDGLQSRRVEPDVAIAVVDGEAGVGNGFCLPAGPLRAPLDAQLRHVHAVLIIGEGAAGNLVADRARRADVPVFQAQILADESAHALAGRKVVAFAGIARPEKFFRTLESIGAEIVARRSFPDHHRYSPGEIGALRALARTTGAQLATTEKDSVRAPLFDDLDSLVLPVAIRVRLDKSCEDFIASRAETARRRP